MRLGGSAAGVSAFLVLGSLSFPALAAPYDFVPAPQTDLNRIYRIDRITGEVSSCQYGLQEGTIGVTLCFTASPTALVRRDIRARLTPAPAATPSVRPGTGASPQRP